MEPLNVPHECRGDRLDAWLSEQYADHSRSRIQQLIKEGHIKVNDQVVKPNYKLHTDDLVTGEVPPPVPIAVEAEDIPLDILFEDGDIIVINKPPALVVHPARGNYTGTLVNALLHHCADLKGIGGELRPGIVHRLDKDTSGVIVVCKTEQSLKHIGDQFRNREMGKEYLALVFGHPHPLAAHIEKPIGRHPDYRKKMAVTALEDGRHAHTIYHTQETFAEHTLLRVEIKTGRTHQIRVHLEFIKHPIVGDSAYGRPRADQIPPHVSRQMLHAHKLELEHPTTGERMNFVADIPPDMQRVLDALREN